MNKLAKEIAVNARSRNHKVSCDSREMISGIAGFLNDAIDDSNSLKTSFNEQRVEIFKLKVLKNILKLHSM